MKVSKKQHKLMDPIEEKDYLIEEIQTVGEYFSWDVHPNVHRARTMRVNKLYKRLWELVASEEYKFYTTGS